MLNRDGFEVGRRHVATLMQRMGIEARYRKPNTSKKHPTHKVYPYLLRGLEIERANQVWATEPKLADSRPAAEMLPRTGGGRAKGGCKARPFADGGVSCAEQPELCPRPKSDRDHQKRVA